ncbi:MAG: HAD family hydrolase [Casimicrobiaceae bacterium]
MTHPEPTPAPPCLRPLAALSASALRQLRFLLFDVDETFTTHGLIEPEAMLALHRLRAAGIEAIPVTGRPAGWGHMMLSTWPIGACVTENGGVYAWRTGGTGAIEQRILHAKQRGGAYLADLNALGRCIIAAHPDLRLSGDQTWRLTDLAIDYAETVPRASASTVAAVVDTIHRAGYESAVSSIHIHASRPRNDKREGVNALMGDVYAVPPDRCNDLCAFIGDSANDATVFATFALSVGVANVRDALPLLPVPPAYICTHERGRGFVEFVDRVLAARGEHS